VTAAVPRSEAARRAGVTAQTRRRWEQEGLVPHARDGAWTPAVIAHEPLMRDDVPGVQMAEEMQALAGELLPLASPIMDRVHQRFHTHFVEQEGDAPVDAVERFLEDVAVTLPDDAREVNLAARVAARAAGGDFVVTSAVVGAAEPQLEFERIGEVRLKGFSEPTERFVARAVEDDA
jgi:hypothetical protein